MTLDRRAVPPRFGQPPAEYDRRYMQDLVRSLETLVSQLQNPGEGRNTRLTLTDLPDRAATQETNGLFEESGFVQVRGHATAGGGITLLAPDGTAYVITVNNAGNLVVT